MTGSLLDRLAQDYAALGQLLKGAEGAPQVELPQMVSVRVKVTAQPLATQAEVERWVAGPELHWEGWMRRQSSLSLCPRADTAAPGEGLPLMGEWAQSERKSYQLLYGGRGWTVWTYEEADAETAPSTGELLLKEDVSLLADRRVLGNLMQAVDERDGNVAQDIASLRYAVYWGGPPQRPSAVRRQFARFLGFGRDEG